MFRKGLARFENDVGVQLDDLPIDANARRINGTARSGGNFRANTIARDQRNWMGHTSLYSGKTAP